MRKEQNALQVRKWYRDCKVKNLKKIIDLPVWEMYLLI